MHENGHGIFDGEHRRPVPPAPRGHAAAGQQQPADASRLVVRPAGGPGSLPAGIHDDGSDPPKAARASDTVPDTGADTPPARRTAPAVKKGGSLPSSPSPLARFGSSGPGRKTLTATAKNGSGGPDTPATVFLTPLPICASDCARPRTRPPLRPRRGPGPDDGRNIRSPPRGWSAGRWATWKSDRWPRAPSSWWVRPRGVGPSAGAERARRAAGCQRRPAMCGTRSARTRWATSTDTNGTRRRGA